MLLFYQLITILIKNIFFPFFYLFINLQNPQLSMYQTSVHILGPVNTKIWKCKCGIYV